MLSRLEIDQFALIEHAEMELGRGFRVITGETGAGKSLLLGAIAAISGSSVSKDLIRRGAEEARVEGLFVGVRQYFADDAEVLSYMEEDDQLILAREIRLSGRNLCRVNGRMVPLSFLRHIGERLVDIHGQNDRQQIFRVDRHTAILDRFGRDRIEPCKQQYRRAYQALAELTKQERELLADPEERRMLCDRLRWQINEIHKLDPKPGEDESLASKRDLLANQAKIMNALARSLNLLRGDGSEERSALDAMAEAYDELWQLGPLSEKFKDLAASLDQLSEQLRGLVSELSRLSDMSEEEEGGLDLVEQRLDAITKLKRKYGGDIPAVLDFAEKASERLARIEEAASRADEIHAKRRKLLEVLQERGLALRAARQKTAEDMSLAICRELSDLGMDGAEFKVFFHEKELRRAGPEGLETAEFLLAANRGENLKPLASTASGGEASRIMLAIKVILAGADETPLLIFDEVDTGISGETTSVVAAKLKRLSESHQILCVTHQAQIAAKADAQFLIYKESDEARTRTYIKPLNQAEREREIARLLSGKKDDASSLKLARQLLE